MADVLDHLALALRGGTGVSPAVRAVAERMPGRSGEELSAVAAALDWGVDGTAAWAAAGSHWAPARRALELAAHAGVPPADLLTRAARDLRSSHVAYVEAATARLSVRLVLPLALAFLPAFVLTTVVPVVLALATDLLTGR